MLHNNLIILESLTTKEAEAFHGLYAPEDKTPDEFTKHIISICNDIFTIRTMDNPTEIIGDCALHDWEKEQKEIEIGGTLLPGFWGKGIMASAFGLLIEFARKKYAVDTIVAKTEAANLKALKFAEKMGFEKISTAGNVVLLEKKLKPNKMNSKAFFDFSIDQENNSIHIQREFDAGLEKVWQAWTTAELLDQWCAPNPYRTETKTLDFREGGYWHYAIVSPEGNKHWSRYDYKNIEPQKSITEHRIFSDENGTVNPDFLPTVCTTVFNEKDGKTLVTISERYGLPEVFEKMATVGHKKGVSSHLKNLDKLLQTRLLRTGNKKQKK